MEYRILLFGLFFSLTEHLLVQGQVNGITFTPQLLCIDNNEACVLGDVNQDGLIDIVAGRLWYAAPDFVPRPVRPLGLQLPEYAKNNGEHLWDMNGDGWLDIVTSGYDETRILWYENPGQDYLNKGMEWKEHVLVDTGITRSEIGLFHDMDNDGIPEYVLTSWHDPSPFFIWHLGADSINQPTAFGTRVGPRNGHGVGLGDINGDDRLDVVFDEGWYQQPAEKDDDWIWHKDWQLDDSSCPMLVRDLNGDGKNDLLFGKGHDYGLFWMEQGSSNEGNSTWTEHLIDESWSQVHTMTMADLDGDGHKELITGKRVWAHLGKDPGANEPAGIYRYVWNPDDQSFQRHTINTGLASTGLFIRVADLNQDDKPDIVVAGRTGTFILWQD